MAPAGALREPLVTPVVSSLPQRRRLAPVEAAGLLPELLQVLGRPADGLDAGEASLPVPVWRVRQGTALFHEGAPACNLYVLRSGTMKCVRTLEDGYEQVLGFVGPGDVLGFDALCRGAQGMSALALEECSVFALPLHELRAWRLRSAALDQALELALSRQLARSAEMAEMMAAVAAEVRLARFLLWLSARMADAGRSPRRLRLSMCRRDVASCLGVAHETVSRSFGMLAEWGCVHVDNREVEILDFDALRQRARSTRGLADEVHA